MLLHINKWRSCSAPWDWEGNHEQVLLLLPGTKASPQDLKVRSVHLGDNGMLQLREKKWRQKHPLPSEEVCVVVGDRGMIEDLHEKTKTGWHRWGKTLQGPSGGGHLWVGNQFSQRWWACVPVVSCALIRKRLWYPQSPSPPERQKLIREQSSAVAQLRPLWISTPVQSNSAANVMEFTSG